VLGIIEQCRMDLATITLRHAPGIKSSIKPIPCRSRENQLTLDFRDATQRRTRLLANPHAF
jgi:hypothetical protein